MSSQVLEFLSKTVFGGSIILVLYLVYHEYMTSRISAENAKIALEEKENEDLVDGQSDSAVIDAINQIGGSGSGTPPKK